MHHRTTTIRARTIQQARVAALCQHLRLAVDLFEQIGLELCDISSNAPQGEARASTLTPTPRPETMVPDQSGKLAYTIKEAAAAVGLSRSKLYVLMGSGELPSIQIGKRRLIPADALQKLISR